VSKKSPNNKESDKDRKKRNQATLGRAAFIGVAKEIAEVDGELLDGKKLPKIGMQRVRRHRRDRRKDPL